MKHINVKRLHVTSRIYQIEMVTLHPYEPAVELPRLTQRMGAIIYHLISGDF